MTALAIGLAVVGCGGGGSGSAGNVPQTTTTIAPSAGGTALIVVPTAAPIVCSPSSILVGVNQTVVIDCTEQGYGGAFTWSVASPAIASVVQSNDLTYTFFNVNGLQAGTTTLSLHSQPGGTGSVAITVAQ
ncbi:MAG TPA: hypothetical protein VMD07_05930 [Candidatus Acidoferrales bacterium]|nr:hypothetical protein [Candidatus Acidoferrales bacterium]